MSTDTSISASIVLPPSLESAVSILVTGIIGKHGSPAPLDAAEETIEQLRPGIALAYQEASDPAVYSLLRAKALQAVAVVIEPPVVLAPDYEPWFNEAVVAGRVKLERWYSYKSFLAHAKGFTPQVIDALDSASSEVVDLLGNPTQTGTWKRRGLVIGDVQSGKTATYIGIVNKAADAGFKLVVLLTGGTESLRQQTQFRVDEGLLGKDSAVASQDKVLGVGKFPTTSTFLRGQGMTTHGKDFVATSLKGQAVNIDPNADHPYVFVIKKNKTPLSNLIAWLSAQFEGEQFDIPMLVVDDESDYASVNTNYRTSGDTSPTVINQKIRELLALTTRSSYMAFTATPFANVFIDHDSYDEALKDDLFPHHYILGLSAPSNYFGAYQYFGTSSQAASQHLVDILDGHDVFPAKHKSHLHVAALPVSLEEALRTFVVASAVRLARGDHGARSMLVNVSRFKHVQAQVYDLVAHEFAIIKNAIEIHGQTPVSGPEVNEILLELSATFEKHYATAGLMWHQVRDKLLAAVIDTSVQLVNSSRDKASDDKIRNMIAVGGDVLSRGLTLEGLTVSYFFRMVGAADTLLQMARWFGYRNGYEDLVRVWIAPDTADQFRFVADVSEELRDQIREMRELGRTPKDFGLLVRKHPESLMITAKRGVSESKSMLISLSGRRIETIRFPANPQLLAENVAAVKRFLAAIDADDPESGWSQPGLKYLGKTNVSRERVADLLAEFKYDRGNLIFANSLDRIIRGQRGAIFQDWTVGIVSGSGGSIELIDGLTLKHAPKRAVAYSPDGTTGTFRVSGHSARLAGSTDLAKTYEHAGSEDLQEPAVYKELPSPTLLIYPLIPDLQLANASGNQTPEGSQASPQEVWAKAQDHGLECLMALKVAIQGEPGSKSGDVTYLLNGPAIKQFAEEYALSIEDEADLDD